MAANPEVDGSNPTAGGRYYFGEQFKYGFHVVNWTHIKAPTFSKKNEWLRECFGNACGPAVYWLHWQYNSNVMSYYTNPMFSVAIVIYYCIEVHITNNSLHITIHHSTILIMKYESLPLVAVHLPRVPSSTENATLDRSTNSLHTLYDASGDLIRRLNGFTMCLRYCRVNRGFPLIRAWMVLQATAR